MIRVYKTLAALHLHREDWNEKTASNLHGLPRRVGSRRVILHSGCRQLCEHWTGMTVGVNWFREKVRNPLFVHLHPQ